MELRGTQKNSILKRKIFQKLNFHTKRLKKVENL